MEAHAFYARFESIIERLLRAFNFHIESHPIQKVEDRKYEIDFVIKSDQLQSIVEIKFYRSKAGVNSAIREAIKKLTLLLESRNESESGLLIVASYVPQELKHELVKDGIFIWDRNDIWNFIKFGLSDSHLLEDFEQLLNEAKQGVDTEDVFADVVPDLMDPYERFQAMKRPYQSHFKVKPPPPAKNYCDELKSIPEGRPGWRSFELKCIEILKHLFPKDLDNWHTQHSTDDELSRFDMVCRIVSQNDFWKSLIQSFQSRYLLFEFKNYKDPIGQDQIYTTERYLYLRGLRSVGFVIARNGGNKQAFKAAKGALREHGKLILILDSDDLCKMLDMKTDGKIPSDYLSEKLDDFLIKLSR